MTEAQLGQWLDALKSGKYVQGQRRLLGYSPKGVVEHCCLGVLSATQGWYEREGERSVLSYPHAGDATLGELQPILMVLNDNGPLDDYQRTIAELQTSPELYITTRS